jgi:hypothetical protein
LHLLPVVLLAIGLSARVEHGILPHFMEVKNSLGAELQTSKDVTEIEFDV